LPEIIQTGAPELEPTADSSFTSLPQSGSKVAHNKEYLVVVQLIKLTHNSASST